MLDTNTQIAWMVAANCKNYFKVKCVFYVFTPKPPICRLGAGIYCNAFYLNLKPQCFNGTKALDENLKT